MRSEYFNITPNHIVILTIRSASFIWLVCFFYLLFFLEGHSDASLGKSFLYVFIIIASGLVGGYTASLILNIWFKNKKLNYDGSWKDLVDRLRLLGTITFLFLIF